MKKATEAGAAGSARLARLDLRREEILDASERIFAEKGYHETGIADIAGALGLGHGTFYRYFKNKHDIALRVFDRLMERLAEIGLSEDPTASTTLDEYRAQSSRILVRWLAFAEEHPHLLRLFHEQSVVIDPGRMSGVVDAYVGQTMRFLQNGVDRGFLEPGLHVRATAEMIVALILEGTRRVSGLPDPAARRGWAEAALDLIFDGVSPRRHEKAAAKAGGPEPAPKKAKGAPVTGHTRRRTRA